MTDGSARNTSGPRLMPEDGDERRPGPLLRLVEPAAERWPQSQDVEIGRRRELDDRVADGAVVEIADRDSGCWPAIVAAKMSGYSAISM